MIHVIFDTSGIGQNKNVRDSNYSALQELVESKKISIHIPYIVKMEVETQETEFYSAQHNQLKKSIKKFNTLIKSDELNKSINYLKIQVDELEQKIKEDYSRFSNAWIEGLSAKVYEVTLDQTKRAWYSYFNGTPPLKIAKFRPDIPDSFICRSIEDIIKSINDDNKIVLIANDIKVVDTFNKIKNLLIYKDIMNFIKSEEIRGLLIENNDKNIDENIGFTYVISVPDQINIILNQSAYKNVSNMLEFMEKYENNDKLIYHYLSKNLPDTLEDETFQGMPLSNEFNNEATILSCEDISNIYIDFNNPVYYGVDHFAVHFTAEVVVNAGFFIDKIDFFDSYLSDNPKYSDMTTEDWNKHVLRAERLITIIVIGLVNVDLNMRAIFYNDANSISSDKLISILHNNIEGAIININSISEIHIKEEEIN